MLQKELFEQMPEEIWAVAVVIGGVVYWTLFTPEKDLAELIARQHDTVEGIAGIAIGPFSLELPVHLKISGNFNG